MGKGTSSYGPLRLRCPKCKVGEDHRDGDRSSGRRIYALPGRPTRVKWCGKYQKTQYRVRHVGCGWVWWTTHPAGKRVPEAPPSTRRHDP